MSADQRERIALAILAAVATARTMVSIAPALRFDADPALIPGAFAGIGPSASMLLDAIGAASIVMLGAARLRAARSDPTRAAGSMTALLVLLPLPAFLVTTLAPGALFDDFWRGATWLVAALAAAVVAGADRHGRAIITGALAGAVAAMLIRSASQLLVEHPALVAEFERSRETFLASRGWKPGSSAALAYERRLRQPEAIAWLGLANVLSGIMASAAVRLAVWGWMSRARDRGSFVDRFAGIFCAVLALGAVAIVFVNGSKGAIAALLVGCAVLPIVWHTSAAPSERRRRRIPRWLALLVLLAPLAALIRGAILGETSLGERSMLFRWHYIIGGLRVLFAEPLTGVGVGGFQDAYARLRPWMSPEEVVSTHSAFLDWMTAFGVGGIGLIVLALVLLARALRAPYEHAVAPGSIDERRSAPGSARESAPGSVVRTTHGVDMSERVAHASNEDRATERLAMIAAGVGAALAMALTSWADLTADAVVVRIIALITAVFAALAIVRVTLRADGRLVAVGAGVSALVLLVHAQVDMDFWLPGSAWWCWLLIGSAASAARPRGVRRFDRASLGIAIIAALVAAAALGLAAIRAGVQERAVERAARHLEDAVAAGDPAPRLHTAALLDEAATIVPSNALVWQAAVEQSLLSLETVPFTDRRERLARAAKALERAEAAFEATPSLSTARLLADARLLEAIEWRRDERGTVVPQSPQPGTVEGDAARASDERLIAALDEALRRDPRSLALLRRRVEAFMLLGDRDRAAEAARRTLQVDASYALDPLRRLTDDERASLERIALTAPRPGEERAPPR